jgi:hypothetical protein
MESSDYKGKTFLTSLAIAAILGLQLYASLLSANLAARVPALQKVRAPNTWPFLDHYMFRVPHYPGDPVDRYLLFGLLEDSTEVEIRPRDVGIGGYHLEDVISAIREDDLQRAVEVAGLWEDRNRKRLIGLRIEYHPATFTPAGLEERPPEVVKTVALPLERGAR